MTNVLQFPSKIVPVAEIAIVPPKGAKAALEKAINKTLENENHVVTIEDEIMIFLFLEGYRIVPIEGKEGAK